MGTLYFSDSSTHVSRQLSTLPAPGITSSTTIWVGNIYNRKNCYYWILTNAMDNTCDKMPDHITASYAELYFNTMLHDIVPFWEQHSIDSKYGGYFTCLDRDGTVYDTDKFVWLQARQIWMFSKLFNEVESKDEWLETAKAGIKFLDRHGRDNDGYYYFSLTREGTAKTHAYNIYTECFVALAWYEYSKATESEEALEKAQQAFQNFIDRRSDPKGKFDKATGAKPLSNFGLSMMTAYLVSEMESTIAKSVAEKLYHQCMSNILERHFDPGLGLIREFVGQDGHVLDTFEGRLVNPGHNLEAIWFLMDVATRIERKELIGELVNIGIGVLERSWDPMYQGIFYFLDSKNAPLQQLEHDQKLWWVHLEALIALAKAWEQTGRADVIEWFGKVHDYTWSHFPDPEYGEWFGYLNRQGEPHLTLKGGKWKGCYHLPRALYLCTDSLKRIEQKNNS